MPYTRSKRAQRLHLRRKTFEPRHPRLKITDNQGIVSSHLVGEAYDNVAELYTELFSQQLDESPFDRALLGLLAEGSRTLEGPVLDVGCGPGHVTNYLADLGLNAMGIDASQSFVDIAKKSFPTLKFSVGDMAALDFSEKSVAGLLCKHSTIHTRPSELGVLFEEFGRVLRPGGHLLLTFFGTNQPSEHGAAFDHQVATAYQCDIDAVASVLSVAGFVEVSRHLRQPRPEERRQFPQAAFLARRATGE